MAMRVPIPDGSLVDLVASLSTEVTPERVNDVMPSASLTPRPARLMKYSEDPIVSSDIVGDPHSCIFDAPFPRVTRGRFVKVPAWYDNEWGYAHRVVDLMRLMTAL
jgi:glyceraldehyde 3-phosphate dehydrogenase